MDPHTATKKLRERERDSSGKTQNQRGIYTVATTMNCGKKESSSRYLQWDEGKGEKKSKRA